MSYCAITTHRRERKMSVIILIDLLKHRHYDNVKSVLPNANSPCCRTERTRTSRVAYPQRLRRTTQRNYNDDVTIMTFVPRAINSPSELSEDVFLQSLHDSTMHIQSGFFTIMSNLFLILYNAEIRLPLHVKFKRHNLSNTFL